MQKYIPKIENFYRVDKTEYLESRLMSYPSVYVEGAAASGKSTLVDMYAARHEEYEAFLFELSAPLSGVAEGIWQEAQNLTAGDGARLYIFEDIPRNLPEEVAYAIRGLILSLGVNDRAILISREKPCTIFLELIWKRRMELISQQQLLFTKDEIKEFAEMNGSRIHARRLFEATLGWPGCVDMFIRQEELLRRAGEKEPSVSLLQNQYVIRCYLRDMVYHTLTENEQKIIRLSALVPWLDVHLCSEVFKIPDCYEIIADLGRKGLLSFQDKSGYLYALNLLKNYLDERQLAVMRGHYSQETWVETALWYEKRGYVREATQVLRELSDQTPLMIFMKRNYSKLHGFGVDGQILFRWAADDTESAYLKASGFFIKRNHKKFREECEKLLEKAMEYREQENTGEYQKAIEAYMNLLYYDPHYSILDWLELLPKLADGFKIRIFHPVGSSLTPLGGGKDLCDLFACRKKEENRLRNLLETYVEGFATYYRIARLEYYYETINVDCIKEELIDLLTGDIMQDDEDMIMVKYTMLCRLCVIRGVQISEESFYKLEEALQHAKNHQTRIKSEAIASFYSIWLGHPDRAISWLKNRYNETEAINPENYMTLFFLAKGFVAFGQLQKAENILLRMTPFLRACGKKRLLMEVLFMMAILSMEAGNEDAAIEFCRESQAINERWRLVAFYSGYGNRGLAVLEAYVRWRSVNAGEEWTHKKKYTYGNVLNMSEEDFLEYTLRVARKQNKTFNMIPDWTSKKERLTMAELRVLSCVREGLSNNEISERLELKLPSVKSHLKSIYRKLGVSNRGKAVQKGYELGILKV